MNSFPWRLLTLLIFLHSTGFAQKLKKADKAIVANIRVHTDNLGPASADSFQAGSEAARKVAEYIAKQFARSGLQPKGDDAGWYQEFEINDGKEAGSATKLVINGKQLRIFTDYFPFSFSANKQAEAAVSVALAENDVPWFKDLKEVMEGQEDSARTDTFELIRKKAQTAASKGASALIIYNSGNEKELEFDKYGKGAQTSIPVLYIKREAFKKYCSDESEILDVTLNVSMSEKKRKGNNVIGFKDNRADSTIITTTYMGRETATASLLELARLLKNSKSKKTNYLFIAYGGEKNGSDGKNYFSQHPSINLQQAKHILDLDTVSVANENPKGLHLVKRSLEIIKSN